ncbi:diguanylate cyclase domain-containing protein [Desulfurivibrio sp. D14AmB]|uniref:diguanylate cyclase domain-containing protein n=1 Tax=Desulfurivibrio sp. D14AmB TaxID=3374370 RepID=UPI00376EFC47
MPWRSANSWRSPFGKDILRNRATATGNISQFITRIPVTEIRPKVENILEIFSLNPECEGTLVTDDGKYRVFLSANALLRLLFEKNIEEARDQNPLTKLPGNFQVSRFVSEGNSDSDHIHVYCYFDFDNFKPFNDKYGMRTGDRAILMFADILKETTNRIRCFVGHAGGDDFFLGFKLDRENITIAHCREIVRELSRRFPLLSVSAAMLTLFKEGVKLYSLEEIFTVLAELKKQAKLSPQKFAALDLNEKEGNESNREL